ncbi:5-methylthioadenosine/S-adenosylhomocysteine deaminase [Halospina denitrificans]|uniref:5-methylthioadenosine/S-adenosylhomocysteine deaminase n=1 Tax=Halospina denitrificans TaxID=332522 RepID=A0A4R7JN64_9GAMM|nr:TRZ/ATZ family hydrolase [Halospina denitrificans]TDT38637.1 5-methylthioadenosine/S-adenosylhomocysteine deaminase [Halospina denitrificans]
MSETAAVDKLISARWVLPMTNDGTVLDNHSIAITSNRITDICPTETARQKYQAQETLDLGNQLLMPGLINAHGHAAMTLLRGLGNDLPLMEWLEDHIWPAEGRFVDEEFVSDGTQLAIAEMLRTGTTCFSDMYFFPETVAETAQNHGIRVQACFPVLDFPTNWGSGPEDYFQKGLALHDRVRNSNLVTIAFGPHAPYTNSDEPLKRTATLAEQVDLPIQIHLHETAGEVQDSIQNHGLRPTRRLAELGLMSPRTQCVHMTQVDEHDLNLLKETGAHVLHCPEANMKLASGACPIQMLMDAGVNVALGTDGAASNNNLDMFGEMQSAALLGKLSSMDAGAAKAIDILRMATINGACAMGIDDRVGSLEPGKQADIIAVDLGDILAQPVYDPVPHLVYNTNGRQVTHSWVAGEPRLIQGELQRMDLHGLRERVQRWQIAINEADQH